MGGTSSVTFPKKDLPNPKPTTEMLLDVTKMHELISTLDIGKRLQIGKITSEQKQLLEKMYSEFIVIQTGPDNLSTIVRKSYNGSLDICCTSIRHLIYWKDEDNNSVYNDYRPKTSLYTCDPKRYDKGFCDDILYNSCKVYDLYSDSIKRDTCFQWINLAFQRPTVSSNNTVNKLFDKLTSLCAKDASIPICQQWIYSMRVANTSRYDLLIDNILQQQSGEFKHKYMKCSYPTDEKLKESLKYDESRECWDPECFATNINFLLTNNYRNLGLCQILRCNTNIGELYMDASSKLRLSCGINHMLSQTPVNKKNIIQHNINNSININVFMIITLSIIVIWILIVVI
ncbi:myristylated protein [Cetacean poxvirus 1]|nr:myristylated protein [Cetacean poxvirus 1]